MKSPPDLVDLERCGAVTVLHLRPSPVWKQLSSHSGDALGDALNRPIDDTQPRPTCPLHVLVNFREVQEFSGQMMALLARLAAHAQQTGGSVSLCHVPLWFLEILQVTKLDHLFHVFADQADAVAHRASSAAS